MASHPGDGNNGMFELWVHGEWVAVVVSDGFGWDHVSVSTTSHVPSWEQMCFVKDVFFGPEEVVMQLHPRASQYVNYHPFCLHLWRPQFEPIPEPPAMLVGPVAATLAPR